LFAGIESDELLETLTERGGGDHDDNISVLFAPAPDNVFFWYVGALASTLGNHEYTFCENRPFLEKMQLEQP
jgi:hypothetical protein